MSEYHSFSLAQHLPNSNRIKKDSNRQSGGDQAGHQSFHHSPFSASNNEPQVLSDNSTFINKLTNEEQLQSKQQQQQQQQQLQQQQLQQQQLHHTDWSINTTATFDILNNVSATNFTHHTRNHTTPAIMNTTNSNDYHPLFDFLPPFDDHLILSHPSNSMTANNNSNNDTSSLVVSTHLNSYSQVISPYI
jgi:hypothetical protein